MLRPIATKSLSFIGLCDTWQASGNQLTRLIYSQKIAARYFLILLPNFG